MYIPFFLVNLLFLSCIDSNNISIKHNHSEVASYEKWGRVAVLSTKERYNKAKIIDYLYLGHEVLSPTTEVEKFKLWLREDTKEYGVYVSIKFETSTHKILNINFKESNK